MGNVRTPCHLLRQDNCHQLRLPTRSRRSMRSIWRRSLSAQTEATSRWGIRRRRQQQCRSRRTPMHWRLAMTLTTWSSMNSFSSHGHGERRGHFRLAQAVGDQVSRLGAMTPMSKLAMRRWLLFRMRRPDLQVSIVTVERVSLDEKRPRTAFAGDDLGTVPLV